MDTPLTILMLLTRVDCVDGVAAYLETIIGGLRDRGDRVVLLSGPVTTPDGSEARRRGIAAGTVEWLVIEDLDARRPRAAQLRRILALIRRHRVDVLAPQGFAVLPYARLLSLLAGLPTVGHYHPSAVSGAAEAISETRSRKERLLYRATTTLFGADRYIAASREIRRFFEDDCGIPPARIRDQVFGVDTDVFRPGTADERAGARRRFGLEPDRLVCVLPGRLNLVKGHDVAIRAARALRRDRSDLGLVFLFAGGGDQRARIEADAFVDEADRDTFRFLGFISDPAIMRDVYWAADIVVLPSRFEGFGLVVAEAMCCGAIVIRTPSGGWQDQVIEGVTGYRMPFNDAPALAAAIVAIADQPDRSVMREAAIAHARARFAKSVMVEGTASLFREARGLRRRRRTRARTSA